MSKKMSAVLLAGLLSSSAVAQAEENSPPAPQASGQASGKRTYKPVKMLDAPKASSDVSESKPSDEAKPDPKVKPKANTLPFKPAKKNGSL